MSDDPKIELAGLNRLLTLFESGFTMRRGEEDITQRETDILKREIARLEGIITDLRLKAARNA